MSDSKMMAPPSSIIIKKKKQHTKKPLPVKLARQAKTRSADQWDEKCMALLPPLKKGTNMIRPMGRPPRLFQPPKNGKITFTSSRRLCQAKPQPQLQQSLPPPASTTTSMKIMPRTLTPPTTSFFSAGVKRSANIINLITPIASPIPLFVTTSSTRPSAFQRFTAPPRPFLPVFPSPTLVSYSSSQPKMLPDLVKLVENKQGTTTPPRFVVKQQNAVTEEAVHALLSLKHS